MSFHKKQWLELLGGVMAATAVAASGGALGPAAASFMGAGGGAGGAGAGAAGAAGATGAAGAGTTGTAAALTPAMAELSAAGGAGAAGAGAGAGSGLGAFASTLGGSTLGKAAIGAGISGGINAATPQYGMTAPGNVQPLQSEDPMAQLQQLMEKHRQTQRGRTF